MRKKCTAAFLSFVTPENQDIRERLFNECFPRFEELKEKNPNLEINLAVVDNRSVESVREKIIKSQKIDVKYLLRKNMFDIALFFAGLDAAKDNESEFVLFTYDDFFIYDHEALTSAVEFASNSEIDCIRVTEYSVRNSRMYDTAFTPKTQNPDSIRHVNLSTGAPVVHTLEKEHMGRFYYTSNWHYTSRPCIWRTSSLRKILDSTDRVKILQGFEGFMAEECQKRKIRFGTLDTGMMKTYPINLSARTAPDFVKKFNESSHTILREEVKAEILASKNSILRLK